MSKQFLETNLLYWLALIALIAVIALTVTRIAGRYAPDWDIRPVHAEEAI